jgi:hypothetical protein
MFIVGPIQMPPADYFQDIAVTYLIIPIVTCGYAYLLMQARAD